MRTITAEEYGALIDELNRLQQTNFQLEEQLKSKKPLEFSQKMIVATVIVAIFVVVCTFILAFLEKDYPSQLVNDIITLTLTAEGGYFCQNGVRSIFTGDKTVTNFTDLKGNDVYD